MKKLGLLVMPLIAVSLLASCGSKAPVEHFVTFESYGGGHFPTQRVKDGETATPPTEEPIRGEDAFLGWFADFAKPAYTFTEKVTKDITLYAGWKVAPLPPAEFYTVTVEAGEDGEFPNGTISIPLKVTPNSNLLEDLSIITKPTYIGTKLSQTFNTFTYDNGNPIESTDKVTSDDIVVKGTYRNKTLEECSWKEVDAISAKGAVFAESFFGSVDRNNPITKTVMVNGQPHKVRIIGYGEDYTDLPIGGEDPDPEKAIGITFEFANLISDENGNSLATQWNDTDDEPTANYNYLDSSIRMALVGEKQEKGHILWAQKNEFDWSTNPLYKNRTVLSMLPHDLISVLKTPSKYINIYNTTDAQWEEKTVKDKLFLLSPKEIGHAGGEPSTSTYTYYKGAGRLDVIKKQVQNDVFAQPRPIPPSSGQVYQSIVISYAGYNGSADASLGGCLWLRSPNTSHGDATWLVNFEGIVSNSYYTCRYASSVAPAFCI